jgi:integrase/recombinase XerC/integrase/recombinase XerD
MRELVPVERLDIVEGEWSPAPASPLRIEDLVERFLVGHDVRKSSQSTYRRQLREFSKWLEAEGLQITALRREHILAYRGYLQERAGAAGQGLSSHSVAGYLTAVRRLFTWLEAERLYPNVARGVKGPKQPRGHKKDILTEDQLRACLEAIGRDSTLGEPERARNYALFNLMARTGLRDIEAARASMGDIRRVDGERVLYVQGKGRDEADEFVLLLPKAYKPLRAYLDMRPHVWEGSPLFVSHSRRNYGERLTSRSISRIIKNTLRAAGLDDRRLTAHSLRHTAITLAVKGGASLEQAQAMARHGSPATTMIYFHNLDRVKNGAEKHVDF